MIDAPNASQIINCRASSIRRKMSQQATENLDLMDLEQMARELLTPRLPKDPEATWLMVCPAQSQPSPAPTICLQARNADKSARNPGSTRKSRTTRGRTGVSNRQSRRPAGASHQVRREQDPVTSITSSPLVHQQIVSQQQSASLPVESVVHSDNAVSSPLKLRSSRSLCFFSLAAKDALDAHVFNKQERLSVKERFRNSFVRSLVFASVDFKIKSDPAVDVEKLVELVGSVLKQFNVVNTW